MPEQPEHPTTPLAALPLPLGPRDDALTERVQAARAGLGPMVALAEAVWRERAGEDDAAVRAPDWEQVFPSQFYEFTNRRH